MIYYEMTQRLEVDQKNPLRPRRELDRHLDVRSWRLPGGAYRRRTESGTTAPLWWRGDEDASQTFLHAMGVVSLQ